YLPPEARGLISVSNASRPEIKPVEFSAQRVRFEVTAGGPAMVVAAQAYYHPWHAYVDGRRARLWEANYAFQALEIPAGHHEIKIVYEDRAFAIGGIISAVFLAGIVIGWWRR